MSVSCAASNFAAVSNSAMSIRVPSSLKLLVPQCDRRFKEKIPFLCYREGQYVTSLGKHSFLPRKSLIIRASMQASFADMPDESHAVFPRINVRDPYKRLGISREASEEEVQAARNFLVKKYAGHKPSVDAIELAHDKIIMQSLYDRRRPKINLMKKVRDVSQSRVVKAITNRFEAPSTKVILKTAIFFSLLGVLTVLFPTEEGPTFQVLISFIASIYFMHDRLRSVLRGFLYGIGAFFASWLLGTILMVSVMPPLLQGPRNLEVSTSLLSYVLLWVSSTYLK